MIGVDLGTEIFVPAAVALIGALVAGLSAVVKSWTENRDTRRRAERQLELADKRARFVGDWVEISNSLDDDEDAKKEATCIARAELREAYREAQLAFVQSKNDSSTVVRQFRRLLMLVRRRNPISYVVSGLFLFLASFVWLLLCIPDPSDDSFSIVTAILVSLAATIAVRVAAEMLVGAFEGRSISGAETIADVSVASNVVTITTLEDHGLKENDTVVVDASNDIFDGTYTVTAVDGRSFSFQHRLADVSSASLTGWVCGDTFKAQMQYLLMVGGGRGRAASVVGGLFLATVLVMSTAMLVFAADELDNDAYPQCYGAPYTGAYFGVNDAEWFLDDQAELDVERAVEFLEELVPLWSPDFSGIVITDRIRSESEREFGPSWTLVGAGGVEYELDEFGLYYASGGTVLYEKGADDRLRSIGDPCDPQRLTLHTTSDEQRAPVGPELFAYFDARAGANGEFAVLYEGQGENEVEIEAYFGRDGRLIPVCSDDYPQVQPCLARDNVHFDSGLYRTVSQLFDVGLAIVVVAIIARLLFGLVAWGVDRLTRRRTAGV